MIETNKSAKSDDSILPMDSEGGIRRELETRNSARNNGLTYNPSADGYRSSCIGCFPENAAQIKMIGGLFPGSHPTR
jgi:hypothetical protein